MRIHNGTVPDTVLIDAATTHDGVAPLSEQFLRGLSEPELGHTHAYILADEQVVALAGMGLPGNLLFTPLIDAAVWVPRSSGHWGRARTCGRMGTCQRRRALRRRVGGRRYANFW